MSLGFIETRRKLAEKGSLKKKSNAPNANSQGYFVKSYFTPRLPSEPCSDANRCLFHLLSTSVWKSLLPNQELLLST